MNRPKTQSPPPAPLPPPIDLREVDSELTKLGYKEGQSLEPTQREKQVSSYSDRSGGTPTMQTIMEQVLAPNAARITELLDYRKKFLESEDKVRRESPRGRAANVLTSPKGDLSTPTLASRTLLG